MIGFGVNCQPPNQLGQHDNSGIQLKINLKIKGLIQKCRKYRKEKLYEMATWKQSRTTLQLGVILASCLSGVLRNCGRNPRLPLTNIGLAN